MTAATSCLASATPGTASSGRAATDAGPGEIAMKVAGKVLIVTGGGNGVGRAVVLEALRRGAKVAAVDRIEAALAETSQLAGNPETLASFPLDITDRAGVAALPGQVEARFGAVDGLIHLAAIIQPFQKVKDMEPSP